MTTTSLSTPILFLVFNRPLTTKAVFEAIRQSQPSKLYIAADGPRTEKNGEVEKVLEVREIATNVDWDCEVHTLFRDKNLGCKMAVSSAITWFFEQEEEGIILEDDCLPDQSFFPYCQELLERYKNDTRIMAISGNNFQNGRQRTKNSYYYSRYPHIWGWATWKRAWNYLDPELSSWPEVKKHYFLDDIGGGDRSFALYWGNIFDKYYAKEINSWDFPWVYSCWIQNGLGILPEVNLVTNIGFGDDATHTKKADNLVSNIPKQSMVFPLKHPTFVIRNSKADSFTEDCYYSGEQKKADLFSKVLGVFGLLTK